MFGRCWRTLWRLEEGDATVHISRTLRNAPVRPLHELRGRFCFAATLILLCAGTVKAAETEILQTGLLSCRPPLSRFYAFNPVSEDKDLDEAWPDENDSPAIVPGSLKAVRSIGVGRARVRAGAS